MASPDSGTTPQYPCVEQPALRAFDTDGDGVLSLDELRAAVPDNAQLQESVAALESHGVAGLKYAGCGDSADAGANAGQDLAQMIARAAVNGLDVQK